MKAHGLVLATVLLALAIAPLLVAGPSAQAQNQWGEDNSNPGEFGMLLGAGHWNCRHWLSSPAAEKEGSSWMLGWWKATNDHNTKQPFVGRDLGATGILGVIKRRCVSNPGMALTNAVGEAYLQIGQAEKKSAK
jgi:hypothetical protein